MPHHGPPRLLTGIALLFWGGLTGHALFGLVAAILIESKSWTTLRWNFTPLSYVRAWHFSVLAAALLSMLAWLDGMKPGKLHTLFVWAPLTLLPLELAQRYGKAPLIALNTFSFFARRKMMHDSKQGYHVSPRMIHIGYPYLAIILLATAVASSHSIVHFSGLACILGACLYFNAKECGFRPTAWIAAFIILLISAYAGHWAIFKTYHYYRKGMGHQHDGRFTSANETRTSIGRLGRLKLSSNIFWRMQVREDTERPPLLRTATYHHYARGVWKHIPSDADGVRDKNGYIDETRLQGISIESNIRYFTKTVNEKAPDISGDANIRLIGEVDSGVLANPIPLPHFTFGIGDLGNDESEASLECNTLGTVRIINPDYHVISYSVWTGDYSTTEVDAPADYDLTVPTQERKAIQRICAELGLKKGMSAQEILARLRTFYIKQFTYTTHLTTPRIDKANRWTAVGIFLEQTRSGHCEYFATATALILRECGIPARYCVGFSVNEFDGERKEWVLRGKHAHAWCRVWNNNQWEDADLTPPSWADMDQVDTSAWRLRLADWWQLLREDFLIWRTNDANKNLTVIVFSGLLGSLLLWIIWKLWKSRQYGSKSNRRLSYQKPAGAPQTALNKIEPAIARKLGRRPHGLPLVRWVMMLEKTDPNLGNLLRSLTKLHSTLRFDPDATNELQEEAKELAMELKQKLKNLSPAAR